MRRTLFLLALAAGFTAAAVSAQTPVQPPAQGPPPATAPRPAPRAVARPATFTIQVTDAVGAPLADTQVTVTGTVARDGVTAADGSLRLLNMRAGTYRVRFTREGSITLERDLTIRAGESPTLDVSLSPAPPPPPPPEPVKAPESATSALGPPGEPKVTDVPIFLEKNFIGGREGRKESPLGCSATGTGTLLQVREALLNHVHEGADEWIYVVAGEGTLRIGTNEQRIQAGTFSMVPHSATHALVPQGRNPLILISILSGPRCQG